MNLLHEVRNLFEPILKALVPDAAKVSDYAAMVKAVADSKNGDYQANFAMPLAKVLGQKPPALAQAIIDKLPPNDLLESASVAGPGFINLKLKANWLALQLQEIARGDRLGIGRVSKPRTFVIDLSGPNVAKPLHVGHLRSTIIGDSLVRILRFLGHTVVGDNHLGDWGTQFGILIHGYKHLRDDAAYRQDPVHELARLYVLIRQMAKAADDEDEGTGEIMDACRRETAKLHAGDPENAALWQQFMPHCLEMLRPIYDRLGVKIDVANGESFYNPMLAGVVDDLLKKGVAVVSNGAVVVPNAKGNVPKETELAKEEPPALIRKRDGAFTYTTTDLATIKYRMETWNPDAMLYVVDARQALHFKTLYANARRWGYEGVEFEHVQFGSILGKDKRPLRTRDGGTIELDSLLDEAVARAHKKYDENTAERRERGQDVPQLNDHEMANLTSIVGIGAVKYADLGNHRATDYIFDYDKMLATEGNTATYMQYAYARCRAIFRKGDVDASEFRKSPPAVTLVEPAERNLALQLLKFEETLVATSTEYLPHLIAGYLWDLAKALSTFYEACPVLTAVTPELKASRLLLVDLTSRTIQQALNLLGIHTVERM